jgi:hypothetical protein
VRRRLRTPLPTQGADFLLKFDFKFAKVLGSDALRELARQSAALLQLGFQLPLLFGIIVHKVMTTKWEKGSIARQHSLLQPCETSLRYWFWFSCQPRKPRVGFHPSVGRDFEAFIHCNLTVGVRLLACGTLLRLVKATAASQEQ